MRTARALPRLLLALAASLAVAAAHGCTNRPLAVIPADSSGTVHVHFQQVENSAATILVVVDNSGSMCEEQFNLRSNIQSFLDSFRTAAPTATFHMGVVTTDTLTSATAGRLNNTAIAPMPTARCPTPPPALDCTTGLSSPLPKWIDDTTPEGNRVFGCLSSVGILGYGAETALGAARMALSPALLDDPNANGGFYIPGSKVLIIILGDEDDCTVCNGDVCGPLPNVSSNLDCSINRVNELTPVADIVAYINAQSDRAGSTLGDLGVYAAAIIGLDPQGNSAGPIIADPTGADELVPICQVAGQGTAAPAPRIETFIRAFDDHLEASICQGDFGATLGELGAGFGARLSSGCLSLPPCPGISAADVVVHVEEAAGLRDLVPDVDYAVVCSDPAPCPPGVAVCDPVPACLGSVDATCPYGWRINFLTDVERGANVEVYYGLDTGDGCTSN
jgi:hypothetical protein